MRIGLHNVVKVADALAVVLLKPQAGIDVAGGGGGAEDGPCSAVEVIPCQLLAVVDLGQQRLALFAGAG